jgi:biopolymer transport protein ExbD
MGRFKKSSREMPELNTSSLPDLIFTVLFFFMMVTTLRDVELKVQFTTPSGTEIERLEKKSLVSFIYIGPPARAYRAVMGSAPRIQLNDKFSEPEHIRDFVVAERENMFERDKPFMKVSLKIDKDTHMGIVTDVKQALRKAWALNIVYSAKLEEGS